MHVLHVVNVVNTFDEIKCIHQINVVDAKALSIMRCQDDINTERQYATRQWLSGQTRVQTEKAQTFFYYTNIKLLKLIKIKWVKFFEDIQLKVQYVMYY